MSGWLVSDGAGYFALGYDTHFAPPSIAVWSTRGATLAEVSAASTQWVQDGIETDAERLVCVYYVNDSCQLDNEGEPDLVIGTPEWLR